MDTSGNLNLTPQGEMTPNNAFERTMRMRITAFVVLSALVSAAWADDILWKKLKTESDLVVLMRHTQPAGGKRVHAHGSVPVVLVSHRPNIDLLTMELVDEGELLVGRANANGEIEVLGRIKVPWRA
jgi:hypothetical protein